MAWITNDKFVMVGNKVFCEWTILKKPKKGKMLYPRKAALASEKSLDSRLLTCYVDQASGKTFVGTGKGHF